MNKPIYINVSRGLWIFIALFLIFGFTETQAQNITVSAPTQVSAGENFRVAYTINSQDISDFHSGLKSDETVEVIAGPFTSTQQSWQMTNGHTSSSSSTTYTYTLYATKKGSYTLPVARATVNGKSVSTRARRISIVGEAPANQNGAPKMHEDQQADNGGVKPAGSAITGKDLFIKVSANKRRVKEQEPILLTYKVYTLVELSQLEGKMPDLTGFHTQEIKLPRQKSFHNEQVNGKNYRCVTWSQYVMYPQMTGKLEIPSITFKGIVIQQNNAVDPFEAIFNGGSSYVEVKRDIVAPGLTIQVDPLPTRPSDYSGGVGVMNISAKVDKQQVKSGEPIHLFVTVSGHGNMKLLKQPNPQLPKDFDQYDAKVTDNTKLTQNGIEGNMVYDFLCVPRNKGKYTIPPITFTYFDTNANSYKTLKTNPIELDVQQGKESNESVSDFTKQNVHDIRNLKNGNHPKAINNFFFESKPYWISLLLPILAFFALLSIFRKRAIENADIVKKRGKNANKVAIKRLKGAAKLMHENKEEMFYDETLRALWGYVGDKLNIPVEKLSRDNISEKLKQQNVPQSTIDSFVAAIDQCEYNRYAPDRSGNMQQTYNTASEAIMNIEENMRKQKKQKKHSNPTAVLLLIIAMNLLPTMAFATIKDNADMAYKKGSYQQAIQLYEQALKKEQSPELYYNLGNAYYRTNNLSQAIIAYERASKLAPADKDIRFNLQFVTSKTIDRIEPQNELFLKTWYKSLVYLFGIDTWAIIEIVTVLLALIFVLLYLFNHKINIQKYSFYAAILCIAIAVLSHLFAFQQKRTLSHDAKAVITVPEVNIYKTPAKGNKAEFLLHEGTILKITDKTIPNWLNVKLADGRVGWIRQSQVEEI